MLQLLVALALGLGEKDRGPTASAGPLLAFAPEQVTGIRIRSPEGEPISVTKTPDGWTIPALADLPAAEHKVTGLLTKLAGLQKGVPVATSEEALKRFKVAADAFERKLVLERGDDSPAILYLGDSPDSGACSCAPRRTEPSTRRNSASSTPRTNRAVGATGPCSTWIPKTSNG